MTASEIRTGHSRNNRRGRFAPPSFYDRIIRQDMRPMPHAVRLGERPYHSAGYAGGKAVCGNIPCDHAAGADDTIVPNRHPGADRHRSAEPAVISDMYGPGIAEKFFLPVCSQHLPALVGEHGMDGRHDCHIGAEIAIVPDGDFGIVLDGQVEICEEIFVLRPQSRLRNRKS